jgi:hypothetical protein
MRVSSLSSAIKINLSTLFARLAAIAGGFKLDDFAKGPVCFEVEDMITASFSKTVAQSVQLREEISIARQLTTAMAT